jgi:hypothetical protein
VLHANVVGENDVDARAIAEKTDDARMGAVENANDAAFGALSSGKAADTLEFRKDVIAVHGVFDSIARNKNVAVEVSNRSVRDDEAVAIVVKDQPAFDFVAGSEGCGIAGDGWSFVGVLTGRLAVGSAAGEPVTPTGKFLDGPAFFEFSEHFEERAAVGLAEVEGAGDFVGGSGIASNL